MCTGSESGSGSGSTSDISSEATILMTFGACPDGLDPASGDFTTDCTIRMDAPHAAIIVWSGGMDITCPDRQYDGTHSYIAGSQTMNLQLSGLVPVVRNAYQVFGADDVNGDTYSVNLAAGETRQVSFDYYATITMNELTQTGGGFGSADPPNTSWSTWKE